MYLDTYQFYIGKNKNSRSELCKLLTWQKDLLIIDQMTSSCCIFYVCNLKSCLKKIEDLEKKKFKRKRTRNRRLNWFNEKLVQFEQIKSSKTSTSKLLNLISIWLRKYYFEKLNVNIFLQIWNKITISYTLFCKISIF